MGVVGIVRGLGRLRSHVFVLVSALLEDALHGRLHLEAGVVGCDENFLTSHRCRSLVSLGMRTSYLFGHCGQVRTIEPTSLIRCSARRSAATYVGTLSRFAMAKTLSTVS